MKKMVVLCLVGLLGLLGMGVEGGKKVATVPLLENCKNIPVGQKQRTKVLLGYLTAVTGTVTNRQVNRQNTRNYRSSQGGGISNIWEEMFVKIWL